MRAGERVRVLAISGLWITATQLEPLLVYANRPASGINLWQVNTCNRLAASGRFSFFIGAGLSQSDLTEIASLDGAANYNLLENVSAPLPDLWFDFEFAVNFVGYDSAVMTVESLMIERLTEDR